MDLTPAFLDRWREHRDLDYLDRVRDVFEQAAFDAPWLEEARLRALAQEASASLRHAGVAVDEEAVKAVVDRGETGGLGSDGVAAISGYGAAYQAALAAAAARAAITPALLDDLHTQCCGGDAAGGSLQPLCDWLASPPEDLHPAVVAALAHCEVLRARRWADGNARTARLVLLMLLARAGYGYRGLLAPSTHWSDPRQLPGEFAPETAETHPAVEHVVHCVAQSLRETVSWVRAEEGGGSLQEVLFGFPLQP